MSKTELFPALPDRWETIPWEKTPYKGVFLSKRIEEFYPKTKAPRVTVMVLKVEPDCSIPKHIHKRESNWKETVTMPLGGDFEILSGKGAVRISTMHQFSKTISSREVFGVRNLGNSPLYFYSRMEPGFTGYGEIEEVKSE